MALQAVLDLMAALMLFHKTSHAPASCIGGIGISRGVRNWKGALLACALACAVSIPHGCSASSSPPPPSTPNEAACSNPSPQCTASTATYGYCTNLTDSTHEFSRYVYDYAPWSLQVRDLSTLAVTVHAAGVSTSPHGHDPDPAA